MAEQTSKWYSVRVELRNPKSGDYDKLHAAMWAAGFRRCVIYQGSLYQLPTGSYIKNTAVDIGAVRAEAQAIAGIIDDRKDPLIWAVRFDVCDIHLVKIDKDPDAPVPKE